MGTVDIKLCGSAIDECDATSFERFIQAFHGAIVGSTFVPLGGMHDGGADGIDDQIFESQARASTFLQATKTRRVKDKIRQTIRRIRAFGRDPLVVIFYFSEPISNIDEIEEEITNEENVTVKIRAKGYIEAHINNSPATVQAFLSFLYPSVLHLLHMGESGRDREFPFEAKTLCAFLGQEIDRRRGNATLLTALTDALILWSLEGTDPDKDSFMSADEICAKIESAIPTAKRFIRSILQDRLSILSSKSNPNGREINWHRKRNGYALRYEERQKLINDNIDDITLYNDFWDRVREYTRSNTPENLHDLVCDVAKIVVSCVEHVFTVKGMELSLFMIDQEGSDLSELNLSQEIDARLDKIAIGRDDRKVVHDAIAGCLRRIIYAPGEIERRYMMKLSVTYFVLFALKNEPRIVEYFNSLSERLVLLVGSDLIIKALSEYHLNKEGQMITTALTVMKAGGADLLMTEPALDEVFTHLHASVLEFENFYAPVESQIDEEFVPAIDRILIRAYFYSRMGINSNGKVPRGWRSYIGQFCSYEDVRRKKSRDGLRMYLCDKFGLTFESREQSLKSIDREELSRLTFAIADERQGRKFKNLILAYNDAVHVLRVYSKRREIGENAVPNPFGYRTWWLTHEKAVQKASIAALGAGKPRFIMRPEFVLNYIALMPSKKSVVDSYKEIFPTILGVTLGKRAPEPMIRSILTSAREASAVDNSRAKAMLNEFSDRLKSDQLRIYETKFETL